MAITFQKQPLNFFDVNEPAIFEFTTDEDLGVNPNNLVADLELKSLYTTRRYVVKNILPNYNSGVFRLDVSGYLKSLILDNFNFRFESSNKQFTIENFQIGVAIKSENSSDTLGDSYVFDSGYIFDDGFIFANAVPTATQSNSSFFPMMGVSNLDQLFKPQYDISKLTILAPKYIEFCEGFTNTVSVFCHDLAVLSGRTLSVGGVSVPIPALLGVSNVPLTNAQINKMYLPTLITTSLNNSAVPVYGISYKKDNCEDVLQFRYYTSYAGYCYFYATNEGLTAGRQSSEFLNNRFYNVQDGRSSEIQRTVKNTKALSLSGTKQLELQDTFIELLNSPKIEVLMPRGFVECKVTGSMNKRKSDFEYSLNVDISNFNQIEM